MNFNYLDQLTNIHIYNKCTPSSPLAPPSIKMSSSEKDLVRGEEPLSSFGNHPTRSGEHDRPPTPEKLAGPSELYLQD
jgi:hypothetical protein